MRELMTYGYKRESHNLVGGWKVINHEYWELHLESEAIIEFIRESTMVGEPSTCHGIWASTWIIKPIEWTREWSMGSWGSFDSKTVRIGCRMCKLCCFEPTCISLNFTPVLPILKYVKCIIRLTQCTRYQLKLSYTSLAMKAVLLIDFRKACSFVTI